MYEENVTYKVGINWKDIIIKVVLLILFILFLIWLFPKNDLNVFYDSIYIDNINTMKEAARNYYTKDRLPQNVGESTSMTLKQMLDNKMLIRFTDKDKNYCDETSSKVEVTKTSENEYVLKVQLNCGDQQDYILETIGCNDVCPSGDCNVAVVPDDKDNNTIIDNSLISTTYYQFRKTVYSTNTINTCPDGYTLSGTKCIKSTTGATIDAVAQYGEDKYITTDAKYIISGSYKVYTDPIKTYTSTEYTCPDGYTLNGAYCIKYTPATEVITGVNYTCPDGYTLSNKSCYKTYEATYHEGSKQYICDNGGTLGSNLQCTIETDKIASYNYTCPVGYTLSNNSCYKTYDATYHEGSKQYICDNGGKLNNKKCTIETQATESTTYTCPSGYTKNGTSCYKVYSANEEISYTCPDGYTLNGKTCTKETKYNATKTVKYTCNDSDTLKGTTCYHKVTTNAKESKTYGSWVLKNTLYYSTSTAAYTHDTDKLVYGGAISGAQCGSACGNSGIWYYYSYYTRSVNTSYKCDSGSIEGKTCVTYTTYNAKENESYKCDSGSLSGKKCIVTEKISATKTKKYTCPNGGKLSNGECTITKDATSSTTYTCPSGYTKDGNTCYKTYDASYKQSSGQYVCENGGNLNNGKCTITKSANANATYTCPTGFTEQNNKCVKIYSATLKEQKGSYVCTLGGTLNGTTCTLSLDATKEIQKKYVCPDGYELEGSRCKLTINANSEEVYSYTCPSGYTAEGTGANTKCYIVKQGDKQYYCEDADATLNGTSCVKVIKGEITGYTCPSEEYNLNGNKCTKISNEIIDATQTTKTTKSYKYKWSTESILDGWEFTGKTKVVTDYSASQK